MKKSQAKRFQILSLKKVVQRFGWIFTTSTQTQNGMSHLSQTTHGIV